MSFVKYAAPVAALVASVAADCTFSTATTITAPAGVSALATCTAVRGDVVFATGAAAPTLDLSGIQSIDGRITYEQDNTVSVITAPQLTTVSGAILFNNLSALADIEMTGLQQTNDFVITNCGQLSKVTTGPQYSEAGLIEISNTYLNTLGGFGNLTKVSDISLSGNPLLADITMNIGSVKTINIGSNEEANQGLQVRFDNLTMATSINVQNATNVSFNSLMTVTENLYLIFNNFDTFAAPNLTYAGGVALNSNANLKNISLPALQTLNGTNGTFQIANNTNLQTVGGFPKLTDCEHDVIFLGNFQNVTDVSQLKNVAGAFYVASTEDISDSCKTINGLKSSQVIRGKAVCTGKQATASGTTSTSGGSSSGSGGSSSSSAAAGTIDIPALPALSAGLGAALLQFLLSF